jgi:hypothetical protein
MPALTPRYVRNSAILAKTETTYGTDPTPTGSANAILVSNLTITPLVSQNVSRDLIRGYFGGSEQLVGTSYVQCTFDVELSGSGTAGTAPAYGPLLIGCGMAETVTASYHVVYDPISTAQKGTTIWYYVDGVKHVINGARGNVEFKLGLGERPVMSFTFQGLDGGVTATSTPSQTLTAFKAPIAITDTNTSDFTLGSSLTLGSAIPAISGGTTYPSRGLSLSLGNTLAHVPLLGGESVDITGREVTGRATLDLTAAQQASFHTDIKANTTTTATFLHGTATGYKFALYSPAVQRINPAYTDQNGRVMTDLDLRFLPSSGNDEIKLVVF